MGIKVEREEERETEISVGRECIWKEVGSWMHREKTPYLWGIDPVWCGRAVSGRKISRCVQVGKWMDYIRK